MHRVIEQLDEERKSGRISVWEFPDLIGASANNWHNHINYVSHKQLWQIDKYAALFGLKLALIDMTDEEILGTFPEEGDIVR